MFREAAVNFLRPGAPILVVGAFAVGLAVAGRTGWVPPPQEIAGILGGWLAEKGLWFVLIAYFVEGLFVISLYLPGSFVLFSAALAVHSAADVMKLWLVAQAAAALSLLLDYFLGRFGLHMPLVRLWGASRHASAADMLARHGPALFFVAGFHINWLAILTTLSGSGRVGLVRTLALALSSHSVWSFALLWLMAALGGMAASTGDGLGVGLGVMAIGLAWCAVEAWRARRLARTSNRALRP